MTSAEQAPARPLRADAARNRARLLAAAEEVFAAKGTGASTEEVARAAGVGVGTVFRHFPTKESLLEAVFAEHLDRLGTKARELRAAEGPGPAFFAFFTLVVERAAAKNALADALQSQGVDTHAAASAASAKVRSALEALLADAQRAGAVRADIGFEELRALLIGASRAVEHSAGDREVQGRILAVLLDGLRPPAP